MYGTALRKSALFVAMGIGLASMAPGIVHAQNVNGAIAGRANAGDRITVTNTETGLSRSVAAGADGSYRLSQLPVGSYSLQVSRDGQPLGEPVEVGVSLGNATTINLGSDGVVSLSAVQVIGSRVISPVDVTSTESATNITAEEIERLPVERDVASVALLAPGVAGGSAGFGGISFGGSSVAENAFYINGLNVTDFYNRVGFSQAPFDFYQEFQVKTGGYSVEYGRTTGGVVNAIAKSGSNDFHYGAKLVLEPRDWQSSARDSYLDGDRYLTRSKDSSDLATLNAWASGPIMKDRLFFFAMYEARDVKPESTSNAGTSFTRGDSDNGFWATTLDWQLTDNNLLSLMAFSNDNRVDNTTYAYDFDAGARGDKLSEAYSESGGDNWALTWTSHFTDTLSMKLMHGRNERNSVAASPNDGDCNYVTAGAGVVDPGVPLGCTNNATIYDRNDQREQTRADFEWALGDHLLRFGLDRETNTSDLSQDYAGPGGIQYNVYSTTPGAQISGAGIVPPGYFAYVRARRYSIFGEFESRNEAFYLEDNWSVTDNVVLNLGIRNETFDNRDAEGRTYIEMDDMWAPRAGFAWDMKGDGTTKLFGNVGRYFLPVANVINIKQGGALLDERTYYGFDGWDIQERDGVQYAVPILGTQFGFDNSQGDGTVGDLRAEVDADMDPVYQDELILGFQQQINSTWSWGVRGTYRKLHNAIDDINLTATHCGRIASRWVMANPGEDVTVWGDTDCDGVDDGYLTVDTSKMGYWTESDNYAFVNGEWEYVDSTPTGQRGWVKPRRTYKALEFQVDRAWDGKWAFNAAYTLSWNEGNAEGPVNTDTNFGDTGRTENFDDPFVNYRGDGPLANDHRHQIKLRGSYAFNDNWSVGATLDARSGGPITAFGVGNPYNWKSYHSYFICVENCTPPEGAQEGDTWSTADRVFEHSPRGGEGNMPWIIDVGMSLGYERAFSFGTFEARLSVYNLFNRQEPVWVYQDLEPGVGDRDEYFGKERFLQSPRYGQLTLAWRY
ncbi:TonB-dependent receptor [Marilutibacter aestuarii]|uniref:TonB-dependent receptor n=1 Tax=Marilutibacter aestuarii TaxID=1706195 RepID=A0A508A062_9GAMM|nr:TonB-dependent receptor [Lysobacter aestuarii]TQD42211.1 TonB-dependent receptor [Lysobacter aestuarii]